MDTIHRLVFICSLIVLAAATAGTKACQESYVFAPKAKVGGGTVSPTPSDDGDIISQTPTATVTPGGPSPTATVTPGGATPTPDCCC